MSRCIASSRPVHREVAQRPWMGTAGEHGSGLPLAAKDADGLKSLPDAFNPLHLLLLPPPLPAASPPYLLLPAPHPCTSSFLLLSLHSPVSASLHYPCNPPAPLLLFPSSLHPPLSAPLRGNLPGAARWTLVVGAFWVAREEPHRRRGRLGEASSWRRGGVDAKVGLPGKRR